MIMNVKKLFLEATKSRIFIALWILILIQAIFLIVLAVSSTRSGLTIYNIRCELGGCVHLEAPWYYTLYFAVFSVILLIFGVLISLKLLQEKGRTLALAWLWMVAGIFIVSTVWISAILHVVELMR